MNMGASSALLRPRQRRKERARGLRRRRREAVCLCHLAWEPPSWQLRWRPSSALSSSAAAAAPRHRRRHRHRARTWQSFRGWNGQARRPKACPQWRKAVAAFMPPRHRRGHSHPSASRSTAGVSASRRAPTSLRARRRLGGCRPGPCPASPPCWPTATAPTSASSSDAALARMRPLGRLPRVCWRRTSGSRGRCCGAWPARRRARPTCRCRTSLGTIGGGGQRPPRRSRPPPPRSSSARRRPLRPERGATSTSAGTASCGAGCAASWGPGRSAPCTRPSGGGWTWRSRCCCPGRAS
mmetsp:Transcript_24873/g.64022  ORF Transcript_24873/g.64022 Transcript_24873/m.64022 type:complete len:296 (+) Transcript_24873:1175-2062(+)